MSNQETTEPTASASLDTLYDLLANQRRRYAISCLQDHGSIALPDLADEVVCYENDAPITEIPEKEVLRVYSTLWHAHIPKLAEAGVVEYDQEQDIVTLGGNADQVDSLPLTNGPEGEDSG
ncbi:DUF7344 domain-containing protein [Halorientalis salina]|uniref:DUF7344 domain-containing protein n=1 Tax=Halorientalis salina TaxID=2932266 RepID=UPI0010ABBC94|nr:hypothetical protein [Halorientalis salina]